MNTADGTYVNGIPIQRQILQPGDQIVMGKTVLEFALKDSRQSGVGSGEWGLARRRQLEERQASRRWFWLVTRRL